ncbi:hypothetical protein [Synechococcus sp. BA-132 BA5]|uniref:hypothetical protein n=1 Tax=Synechococcus sp. BA-132 BA5 TaxID=3110252 RepID=UPI002B1F426D|nr:hypothetical protein [Synechococcus sp. BA-132 BA5]MEA5414874.1 hypothetical protein [Synechococcus sp. BA-132 BA5]
MRNLLADQLGCDPGKRHGLAGAIASRQRNLARTAQALLQILSRQAPTFASRCTEFEIDAD